MPYGDMNIPGIRSSAEEKLARARIKSFRTLAAANPAIGTQWRLHDRLLRIVDLMLVDWRDIYQLLSACSADVGAILTFIGDTENIKKMELPPHMGAKFLLMGGFLPYDHQSMDESLDSSFLPALDITTRTRISRLFKSFKQYASLSTKTVAHAEKSGDSIWTNPLMWKYIVDMCEAIVSIACKWVTPKDLSNEEVMLFGISYSFSSYSFQKIGRTLLNKFEEGKDWNLIEWNNSLDDLFQQVNKIAHGKNPWQGQLL